MPYVSPTLAEFRALYLPFAAVPDATVQAWLDAGDLETLGWPDIDRATAVMLYSAHSLAETGQGSGAMPIGVTSLKSGTFSASFSQGVASRHGFHATIYGRRYLALMRRHFGGPFPAWNPPTYV